MPLTPGTTLGPYEIQAPLGAGGMGEVYKARDTRLDRTVAIKVLPEHVAADPDLKQRFEREARTVAALNHPHICTLHDIGSQDGIDFLVMEYLDGETLAQRLEKGALPLDQALQIAIQIADALDKAHRQGIVHRDLKPGNIMLTKAGAKLLDFGLAKLKPATQAAGSLTALPTQEAPLTQQGAILGTFQYMAPEQLEGADADTRSDIFSFGAVVYEMVTGRKAFDGKNHASLIAAILDREPEPMSALQPMSPALLDYVVTSCLAKDPDDRWQSAADVGRQMKGIVEGDTLPSASGQPVMPDAARMRRTVGVAAAASVIVASITGLAVWSLTRPAERELARFTLTTPIAPVRSFGNSGDIAISPDGARIVYVAAIGAPVAGESRVSANAQTQLYVRTVDQRDPFRLGGVEQGVEPFFSPDGNWVGYVDPADRWLKTVSIQGGPPVPVVATPSFTRGASWGLDDTIIWAEVADGGLFRVSADGGEREPLTELINGEESHRWPEFLPSGRAILFTVVKGTGSANMEVAALDLDTGERKSLIRGGSNPHYAPTGHIVYGVDGTLRAVGFDADRLELTSDDPVPVVEGVGTKNSGAASFALASNGTLVYVSGEGGTRISLPQTLLWVDREGREEPIDLPPNEYQYARLSPDGNRLALGRFDGYNRDIWILELASGTLRPLTTDPGTDAAPLWTPDGERVIFRSGREQLGSRQRQLWWKVFDSTEEPEHFATVEQSLTPLVGRDWSLDGKRLVFWHNGGTDLDIGVVSVEGEPTWEALLHTEANEAFPAISPDGAWIAYMSDQTGRAEVYVQRFPELGQLQRISTEGGSKPRWSRNGTEVFYANGNALMVVPIETGPTVRVGIAETVFEGPGALDVAGRGFEDISPDGQRFLIARDAQGVITSDVVLVQNWFDELQRLVPTP